MYRKFIATITAASIALTAAGASPVFAGDRDTQRAIAALLGLAAVGIIIADNKKRDEQHETNLKRGLQFAGNIGRN